MSFHRLFSITALAAIVSFTISNSASAGTLLSFGQVSNSNTVFAINSPLNNSVTMIEGVNVQIDVTQAQNASVTAPFTGYLNFSLTSSGAATTLAPLPVFGQEYFGNFEITSGANDTGTNYLSGTGFTFALTGTTNNATTFSLFSTNQGSFTSSIMTITAGPKGVAFSFGNVTGLPSSGGQTDTLNANNTVNPFTSSVSGSFTGSSSAAVPEPSSMALLGIGGIACVLRAFRRRAAATA